MIDFSQILPRLYTGGQILSPADVDTLVATGITHIIDCQAERDDAPILHSVQYLWNGVNDDGLPKPAEWFKRSLDFALPALISPHCKVYVHCAAGRNRGPSTAYALMRALGFSAVQARALINLHRPVTIGAIAYASDADRAIVALGYEP